MSQHEKFAYASFEIQYQHFKTELVNISTLGIVVISSQLTSINFVVSLEGFFWKKKKQIGFKPPRKSFLKIFALFSSSDLVMPLLFNLF